MPIQHPTDLTESIKLGFDAFKHLATLNAGSIVLIGTFLQGIFPSSDKQGTLLVGPLIKGLIAASFVCFGLSLALAAVAMYRYTIILEKYLSDTLDIDRDIQVKRGRQIRGATLGIFVAGLVIFGIAVVLNLYR
jgi:hypothetical protein